MVLTQLLPYRGDTEVDEMVELLEANLYGSESRPVDSKVLKRLLKRIKGSAL